MNRRSKIWRKAELVREHNAATDAPPPKKIAKKKTAKKKARGKAAKRRR